MNDTIYILFTFFSIIISILLLYGIIRDTQTRKKLFDIQIEMSKAQQAMTKELPWSELKKIIDEIVDFTVSNYIIINGVKKLTDEELALNWTLMLNDICTDVEMALSDEMKRQILKTISEDYLTRYIKNSVQLVIVYRLQDKTKNKVGEKLESIQKNANSLKD